MRAAAWLLLASALGGCALGGGDRPAHVYHTLRIAESAAAPASAPRLRSVLVPPVTASPFYASDRIVYSRAPATRAYYQFNSWTEPLAQTLRRALVGRLEASKAFVVVATSSAQLRRPLVLQVTLDQAFHEASASPGTVRVDVSAELSDPSRRDLLRRRSFSARAPVLSYDASGAASAIGVACADVLDQVSAWAVGEAAPPS